MVIIPVPAPGGKVLFFIGYFRVELGMVSHVPRRVVVWCWVGHEAD